MQNIDDIVSRKFTDFLLKNYNKIGEPKKTDISSLKKNFAHISSYHFSCSLSSVRFCFPFFFLLLLIISVHIWLCLKYETFLTTSTICCGDRYGLCKHTQPSLHTPYDFPEAEHT